MRSSVRSRSSRGRRYSEVELGERVLDSSERFFYRALLSTFAVVLLWLSSLSVVSEVVVASGAIPGTPVDVVVDEVMRLVNETRRMRAEYTACVASELDVCNATLVHRVASEADRSSESHMANVATREEAKQTSVACVQARGYAQAAVSAWQSAQSPSNLSSGQHYLPSCPDVGALASMTGDTTAERSASMRLVEGYSAESRSTVATLGDQVVARANYDRDYLYNRTLRDASLDASLNLSLAAWGADLGAYLDGLDLNASAMLSCASFGMGACPTGQGAADLYNQATDRLVHQFDRAVGEFDKTKAMASDYIAAASSKLDAGAAAFATIYDTLNALKVADPNFPGFSDLFPSLSGPAFPSFSVSIPSLPDRPELSLAGVPSVGDLADTVRPAIDAYASQVERSLAGVGDELDALLPSVRLNLSDALPELPDAGCLPYPCDYLPPSIDAPSLVAAHDERSDRFEQDAAIALDAFDEAQRREAELNGTSRRLPRFAANLTTSDLLDRARQAADWLNYKLLDDAGLQVEWVLARLVEISTVLKLLDLAWRTLETVRIFLKFWRRSALAVQPVDVRTDVDQNSRGARLTSPLQRAALIATHPVVTSSVVLLFALLVGYLAYALYVIPFAHYVEQCTARDAYGLPVGDGTVLTRNAYNLAYNYATDEGNKARLLGLDDFELRRSEACSRHVERAAALELPLREDMELIVSSHVHASEDVALMRQCYDVDFLDEAFAVAAAAGTPIEGRDGTPFDAVSVPLAETACDARLTNASLEDGLFDCAQLDQCTLRCDDLVDEHGNDGSGAEELYAVARSAMCSVQHWVHSLVLRAVFSAVIWVFVNISRVILLKGVVRVAWEWTNSGQFTFLGTANLDGTKTYEEDLLAERIRRMLVTMRLTGVALILIAISGQTIWIFPLLYFKEGLNANFH